MGSARKNVNSISKGKSRSFIKDNFFLYFIKSSSSGLLIKSSYKGLDLRTRELSLKVKEMDLLPPAWEINTSLNPRQRNILFYFCFFSGFSFVVFIVSAPSLYQKNSYQNLDNTTIGEISLKIVSITHLKLQRLLWFSNREWQVIIVYSSSCNKCKWAYTKIM